MKKYVCDICEKDCDETEYVLPTWVHACGGIGNKIIQPQVYIDRSTFNLCPSCKKVVADFVYNSRNYKKEETKNEI